MAVQNPTALVVDDDVLSRRVVTMALEKEGFSCAQAVDGEDALTQLSARMFDLVVTDLRMPKINGHELSTELLTWTNRPIIVAHTGVDDLRLAKDLLARGVDDIIYKPANYEALAAKFKALVDRRKKTQLEGSSTNSSVQHNFLVGDSTNQSSLRNKVSMAEFESRLATVWQILPISRSAFELLDQTRKEEATVLTIAGIIQRDAALTAEVLRLANSAFYKTNTRAILDVEEAVSRIGMRRLSELAVAMSAMGALSKSVVSWLDTELASQRSLAGGIAVSRLLDAMGRQEIEDGIVLAAVMYPLGRVILGTLFPTLYEQMLATSRRTQIALRQLEREVFPEPHSAATARVLAHWALPQEVYGPLAYTAQNFDYLPQLNEPTRSNVTLIKTGILLGQIAVGRWLQGDLIDLPSIDVCIT